MNYKLSILCLLVFVPPIATAQTSKDFAEMGTKSWAAFQCSSLSSAMKNEKEETRLFKTGYDEGKRFLTAVQAGKVTSDDLYNEIPSAYSFAMFGPTVDFQLGRIYEIAIDYATKGILANQNGSLNSADTIKSLAENKYTQRNCKLIR